MDSVKMLRIGDWVTWQQPYGLRKNSGVVTDIDGNMVTIEDDISTARIPVYWII